MLWHMENAVQFFTSIVFLLKERIRGKLGQCWAALGELGGIKIFLRGFNLMVYF